MSFNEGVLFCIDLYSEKDGGGKVPFLVRFYKALKQEDGRYEGVITIIVNGEVKRERKVAGLDVFGAALYGIRLVSLELNYFFIKEGYQLYRKVIKENGEEEYHEVGIDDIFPYAKW